MSEYSDYLAEKLQECINYNEYISNKITLFLEKESISYANYIADNLAIAKPQPSVKEIRRKKLEKIMEISNRPEIVQV